MKTILTTLAVLFISLNVFSQDKAALVDKVMKANNGDSIFVRLQDRDESIPEERKAEFKAVIQKKAQELQEEAKKFFMKKYSSEDLEEIYKELTTPGVLSLSDKTSEFIRYYRGYKIKFQKFFKEQYVAFQQ